jgi:hypothetical protein
VVRGAAIGRTAIQVKTCREVSRPLVLTFPKSQELSPETGMRTRLEGTQASGEGESHTQKANVAEVSHGKLVITEPEYPEIAKPPDGERSGRSPA